MINTSEKVVVKLPLLLPLLDYVTVALTLAMLNVVYERLYPKGYYN